MTKRFRIKGASEPSATPDSEERPRRGGPRAMPRVDMGLGIPLKVRTRNIHEVSAYSRYQVTMMAAYGIQQKVIARLLKIHEETLVRKYKEELELGRDRANIIAAGELFKMVTMPRMNIVKLQAVNKWLSTRHREAFGDVTKHEHSGPDGKPIETDNTNANLELDDTERAVRLLQLLAERKAKV